MDNNEFQKTPCTDECYVRISDLKQAIMENPYDPAKGEIASYLRYLKYNTPFITDAWIPVYRDKPKAGERVLLCLDNNEITVGWWSDEYNKFDWWDDSVVFYDGVIAWMPLPKAYRGIQRM